MNTLSRSPYPWALIACCMLTLLFIGGCSAISSEPKLARQPTETVLPPTPSPTPVPVIEVGSLSVKAGDSEALWKIFGTIRNISADGLADLELSVSVLGPENGIQAQQNVLPALRQIAPGESTAFQAEFDQLELDLSPEHVLVQLSSFQETKIDALQISVDELSARLNYEGGTTYLGYLSNPRLESGELRNLEAFIMDMDGTPIDSADLVLSTTSIEPRDQMPFRVDFSGDYGDALPEFYIDAIPSEDLANGAQLWTVSEPSLFFTSQNIAYYLIEIKNQAFAPQQVEGIFTLTDGDDLQGLLPVHSPSPIPAQSSWYLTLEPALGLPSQLRNDPDAIRDLSVNVIIDPLKTRGIGADLVDLELEVEAIESIGGSIYFQGSLKNPSGQGLSNPAVFAVLRDVNGQVVSANSELAGDTIPAGETLEFTLSSRIPAGIQPTALEFDLTAVGVTEASTAKSKAEPYLPVWYNFYDPGAPGF